MPVTVKAHLFRGATSVGNPQLAEIRQFDLNRDAKYKYLEDRVATIFPNLIGQSLRFYWRDDDDDYIAFSTNKELLKAIKASDHNVLKIYVTSGRGTHDTATWSSSPGTNESRHSNQVFRSTPRVVRTPSPEVSLQDRWAVATRERQSTQQDNGLSPGAQILCGLAAAVITTVVVKMMEPDEEPEAKLHPGINCDSCYGPIRGIRYKCMVCRDFDLCQKCKSDGMHAQHMMLTIEKPLQNLGNRSFQW